MSNKNPNSEDLPNLIQIIKNDNNKKLKISALARVTDLSRNHYFRQSLLQLNIIYHLSKELKTSLDKQIKVIVAHGICNLAIENECHQGIIKYDTITYIVNLLFSEHLEESSAGVLALANLARNSKVEIENKIFSELGDILILVKLLKKFDDNESRDFVGNLLVKLSWITTRGQMFFSENQGLEALVTILSENIHISSKEKVVIALFNASVHRRDHYNRIVEAGGIMAIIEVMSNASINGKYSALLLIQAFTINNFEEIVIQSGGVEAVTKLLDEDLKDLDVTDPSNFYKEITKTLYELSVGKEHIKERISEGNTINKLVSFLDSTSNRLRSSTLKLLYGLAVSHKAKKCILDAGAAKKLVTLLHRNGNDSEYAATTVRNLVYNSNESGSRLVTEGVVLGLLTILQFNESHEARKQALAAIVNLSNEPLSEGPISLCKSGAVKSIAHEALLHAGSKQVDKFQWAAWCAVVLHNLMDCEMCFPYVHEAIVKEIFKSPLKDKLTDLRPTEFKKFLARLASNSDLEYL